MTKDIYEQYHAAFASVSAYVILKNGERVATIAFKFPRDGAGRFYAYVHWIGTEMVRGHADGYGYDKKGAAVESAARKMPDSRKTDYEKYRAEMSDQERFRRVMSDIDGQYFEQALEKAGFTVLQAV